jgi:hypothetical protein
MKIETKTISCRELKDYPNSNRLTPFSVIKYTLNYESDPYDKNLIDQIILEGSNLANAVNGGAANNAAQIRPIGRRIANGVAGVLAEHLWKKYINAENEINVVDFTLYDVAANQIDLITTKKKKKIEVRSSFPRNGIQFAVCHSTYQFDIIGPYNNDYKPGEIEKDFYTRTLYHLQSYNDFMPKLILDGFEVFLTGGATWNMMIDDTISKVKDFVPEDEMLNRSSHFRVVPFSKALDSLEIKNLIIKSDNE